VNEPRIGRLPGLDVLRALAVTAVVAYHAPFRVARGGFLGVDIFFVISGFLITKLMLDEFDNHRGVDLRAFWWRRAKRLLPATLALLAVTAVLLLSVDREVATSQRGDIIAALAYISNWYQLNVQRSYFSAFGRPPLLRHLWSLAIEEQFYLAWPLVMGLLLRRLPQRLLGAVLALSAVASAVWMFVLFSRLSMPNGFDASSVYLRTDTRVQAMLFGAAMAVWRWPVLRGKAPSRWMGRAIGGRVTAGDLVGVFGLGGLLAILAVANEGSRWLYQGGFFAVAVTTSAVLASVTHPDQKLWPSLKPRPKIRGFAPLDWLGKRSYGIYLWHWPIFVHTRPGIDVHGPPALIHVARIAATLVIAEASYRWIEQPIRTGSWRRARLPVRRVSTVVGALAAIGLVGELAIAEPVKSELQLQLEANSKFLNGGSDVGATDTGPTTSPIDGSEPTSSVTTSPPSSALLSTTTPTSGAEVTSTETTILGPNTTDVTSTVAVPTTISWALGKYQSLSIVGLAIGDSVMLGGARALREATGPNLTIDAKENRSFIAGIDLLRKAHKSGSIGDVLIIHLGTNGPVDANQLESFLKEMSDVPLIVLVNLRVPGFGFVDRFNASLLAAQAKHTNVQVADWFTVSGQNPQLLYRDGTHIRPDVARVYANVIVDAILRSCGVPIEQTLVLPKGGAATTRPTTTTTTTTTTTAANPANAGGGASTSQPERATLCSGLFASTTGSP
jgi:peptidoglycan/LPS O-acetylase OafA/YrhL